MTTRALCAFAYKRGYRLGGLLKENDEDTYADEVSGFILAAFGFYVQYMFCFHMPFPLNLVFWPFEVAESYIQWTITSE